MGERDERGVKRNGRDLLPLTLDRLTDLPEPCAQCTFWELSPAAATKSRPDPVADKRGWLTHVLFAWGSPGRVAYLDGSAVGYLSYAPAHLVPRALAFPTAPVADDALLLLTGRVASGAAGQGIGRMLVQVAAKDAVRRGYRAFEVFASTGLGQGCLLPSEFLGAVGFQTVREHAAYPRMRLDLRTALAWREDVEAAVERLLAPVRGLGRPQPSPGAGRESVG